MVDIFDDAVTIKRYYLLWLGSRRIPFTEIESVAATNLKRLNGRFRLQAARHTKKNLSFWRFLKFVLKCLHGTERATVK